MIPIILYGDRKDNIIKTRLCKALKDKKSFSYISDRIIEEPKTAESDFIIYDISGVEEIKLKKGILVFKSHLDREKSALKLSDGIINVVDPDNIAALSLLKDSPNMAVTCGMSSRCTLTISSIEENSAALSLQRKVALLSGGAAEPSEISVSMSERIDGYALLAISAVFILAGYCNDGKLIL